MMEYCQSMVRYDITNQMWESLISIIGMKLANRINKILMNRGPIAKNQMPFNDERGYH